ncbi:hypothetical protein KHA96_09480 [Bacillus sp. FJAT-49711]|uniref:hypothetical protein n=1 Tax=Bacillus sp. FJAT-49711 TaxID=2833585 RepID=UPI001BC9FC31|nr:hypothetical protein [Bacillus sp. FJAT-49711]MBS4218542.1 hypothetical protein [Bacillus sp. FJAT-49711]
MLIHKNIIYTSFSQIPSWVENDKLSYKWLMEVAKDKNDKKALKDLLEVGEPPYLEGFQHGSIIRKWQLKYISMFYNGGNKKSAAFFSGLKILP